MKKEYNWSWGYFYFGYVFDISYEICGYFDNRPRINIALGFFKLAMIFPFRNSWTDECDPPKWGIGYHDQTFWIYRGGKGNMKGGGKWWTVNMPWQYDWVRTSVLKKDGTWEHDSILPRLSNIRRTKNFWDRERWKDIFKYETYPYTYTLKDGTVQNRMATIKTEEREWRMIWLKWLPWFAKISRTIAVEFDGEVGERTGSWKGGTIGCGYDLLPNETPLECLRRMEKERVFN